MGRAAEQKLPAGRGGGGQRRAATAARCSAPPTTPTAPLQQLCPSLVSGGCCCCCGWPLLGWPPRPCLHNSPLPPPPPRAFAGAQLLKRVASAGLLLGGQLALHPGKKQCLELLPLQARATGASTTCRRAASTRHACSRAVPCAAAVLENAHWCSDLQRLFSAAAAGSAAPPAAAHHRRPLHPPLRRPGDHAARAAGRRRHVAHAAATAADGNDRGTAGKNAAAAAMQRVVHLSVCMLAPGCPCPCC